MKKLSRLLKALGNERRLLILRYIKKNKTASVSEISDRIGISLKATSKHLTVLKAVNLVESRQVSVNAIYSMSPNLQSEARIVLALF